jgi:ElaB/YqjD/DUF883 family membrane-anchored ribosome-binding protein
MHRARSRIARVDCLTLSVAEGTIMVEPVGNPAIAKMAEQTRAAADHVAEKVTDAIASAKDSVHASVDSVAGRADAVTQWASEKVDAARQGPTDLLEAGAQYIRARPYAAVGVGIAFGYLIGRLRS